MIDPDKNRLAYEQRVNRVIDEIRDHLGEPLSLQRLARVSAFSPFHFHRVFTSITGETLFEFIQRLRIEKAALALTHHRDQSVLEVALDHGFSSAATFARAFKAHFGMSATQWRAGGAARWSKQRKPIGKPSKAMGGRRAHRAPRSTEEETMNVHVKELPTYHVAYMRYVGPFGPQGIPELWQRFNTWLNARELGSGERITLGVAYDDPKVTAAEKCRYDACLVVPRGFQGDKWVNVMDVPGGNYAVADFTGSAHEIVDAWDRVFGFWLPTSGYQPDDRPCFEIYRGNPTVDAKARIFRCELCLPVRPF